MYRLYGYGDFTDKGNEMHCNKTIGHGDVCLEGWNCGPCDKFTKIMAIIEGGPRDKESELDTIKQQNQEIAKLKGSNAVLWAKVQLLTEQLTDRENKLHKRESDLLDDMARFEATKERT